MVCIDLPNPMQGTSLGRGCERELVLGFVKINEITA
jgi:hypothetical protein